ncbi:MAG: 3-hydroxybutyryl-CoA dehydrogenase [Rhodospirillales bacterium]|nr:3-hydroxybutyryl-CoA dehydrogenase [Rhodospirillales bacterium]
MARSIRTIAVIGAGQMGAGIAQVAIVAGLRVYLTDTDEKRIATALDAIGRNLDRQVAKTTLDAAAKFEAIGRISAGSSLDGLGDVDLVIEAVTEDEAVKASIYTAIGPKIRTDALIATNTSSIPISRLAAATDRPAQFMGMHFMNPVPTMDLVELIRGKATAPETVDAIRALAIALGKTPVVSEDFPGFLINRVLIPMINEAIFALHDGVGDVVAIDTALKLGARHPMGPLELADFIGLDTCLAIMRVLEAGFGEAKYRPCPLLIARVEAGWLGRKTGRGFYDYSGATPVPIPAR